MIACVYRSGVIRIARRLLKNTLPIARSSSRRFRNIVDVLARHGRPEFGQSRKLMLCPGLPEARTNAAALEAVVLFKAEVEKRLHRQPKKNSVTALRDVIRAGRARGRRVARG